MSECTEYTVTWTIQLSAEHPRAAAEKAQEFQRDPNAEVGSFDVFDPHDSASGEIHRIDLDADICSDPFEEGCYESLEDGEGYDGACGNCADRQYAEDEEDTEDD